jgi:hypothetical protein
MEKDNQSVTDPGGQADRRSGLLRAASKSAMSLFSTHSESSAGEKPSANRRAGLLKAASKSSLSLFESSEHRKEKARKGLQKTASLSYFDSSEHLHQTRRVLQRNASKTSLFDDTASQGGSVDTFFIEGEWDDVENPCLRVCVKILIFMHCLPEARVDSTPLVRIKESRFLYQGFVFHFTLILSSLSS